MFEKTPFNVICLTDIKLFTGILDDVDVKCHYWSFFTMQPAIRRGGLTATYSTAELCRSIFHTLEPAIRRGGLTVTYTTTELCRSVFYM
jgi:hypothetical protein